MLISRPMSSLLSVSDLHVGFAVSGRGAPSGAQVRAVNGVTFELAAGESLGLVGESGSGKSTTGLAILRMVAAASGRIVFDGHEVTALSGRAMKPLRRHMQIIYQDPFGSLSPRMRVWQIIAEPLIIHGVGGSRAELRRRADALLDLVGLDPAMGDRYPHQFSGGQRQRIGIARGLALSPKLLICDEPVSALDVSIQAQIVNLFIDLKQRLGLAYLFIAHDLAVVRQVCDRVAVMYLGRIVEIADRETLYSQPLHPYTQALLAAVSVPDPDIEADRPVAEIYGEPPSAINPPSGCAFRLRCAHAMQICSAVEPQLQQAGVTQVACHLLTSGKSTGDSSRRG